MTVYVMSEPCQRAWLHGPHAFQVVNPFTPSLVTTISCPGTVYIGPEVVNG